jgi:RNA polymerase sigma-70 factor (ECF subfamily)
MSEAGGRYANEEDMMPMTIENTVHQVPTLPLLPPPLEEWADAALVAAAKGGQTSAFEVLVQRHRRMIVSVAQRFTRIREDAEDIAQQTLQKALTYLHQFEGHSSFSTWLTQIAINEALMWRRKKQRSLEVPMENSPEGEPSRALDFPDPGLSPEQHCLRREREQVLSAALNELPFVMRRAIQLHKLEERSLEETSQAMGLSVPALKSRVLRGRRSLRKALGSYFEDAWKGQWQPRQAGAVNDMPCHQLVCNACD